MQESYYSMTYNFRLFLRTAMRSFINISNTHAQLKDERLIFVLLFYCVWPWWTLFTGLCFWLDDFFLFIVDNLGKPLFLGYFHSVSGVHFVRNVSSCRRNKMLYRIMWCRKPRFQQNKRRGYKICSCAGQRGVIS